MLGTYTEYLNQWNSQCPDKMWLRERTGEATRDWTWGEAHTEINALAVWQDVTTWLDTENNTICGVVASFSEFAVAEPTGGKNSGSSGCFIGTLLN